MELTDEIIRVAKRIFDEKDSYQELYITSDNIVWTNMIYAVGHMQHHLLNETLLSVTRKQIEDLSLSANYGENTVDKPFVAFEPVSQPVDIDTRNPLEYLLARYRIRHKVHADDFTKEIEYLIKKNESIIADKIKDACIVFLDSIRNYERENGVTVCYDERDSEEFYQIHITPLENRDNNAYMITNEMMDRAKEVFDYCSYSFANRPRKVYDSKTRLPINKELEEAANDYLSTCMDEPNLEEKKQAFRDGWREGVEWHRQQDDISEIIKNEIISYDEWKLFNGYEPVVGNKWLRFDGRNKRYSSAELYDIYLTSKKEK